MVRRPVVLETIPVMDVQVPDLRLSEDAVPEQILRSMTVVQTGIMRHVLVLPVAVMPNK